MIPTAAPPVGRGPVAVGAGLASEPVGRILASAAASMMLLAACGDDDGGGTSGGRADYVDAVTTSLREDDETPLGAAQTICMSTAIVDVVGVDTLREAGVSPDELGDADDLTSLDIELPGDAPDRLGAAFGECGLAGPIKDLLVDNLTEDFPELPPEAATCLADNLDDRDMTDGLAARLIDDSEDHLEEPVLTAMEACPSVTTAIFLATAPAALDLSPPAEACLREFVEDNPDLMARSLRNLDPEDLEGGRELNSRLAAACPEATAAFLLATAPAAVDLSPPAEACLTEFVEDNPDLVAASFTDDPDADQELDTHLTSACPELADTFGG